MSYERGAAKYFLSTFKGSTMYVSMYIFGDFIVSLFKVIVGLVGSTNSSSLLKSLIVAMMPPASTDAFIASLVLYPVVGGGIAAISWYLSVPKR